MNRRETLDGFYLDHHPGLDQQIGAADIGEQKPVIFARNRHLAGDAQATPLQVARKDHFIDGFKKARSETAMQPESGIDNFRSDDFNRFPPYSSRRSHTVV